MSRFNRDECGVLVDLVQPLGVAPAGSPGHMLQVQCLRFLSGDKLSDLDGFQRQLFERTENEAGTRESAAPGSAWPGGGTDLSPFSMSMAESW